MKRPHLVIYLDTDVDVCLKRIKEKEIVSFDKFLNVYILIFFALHSKIIALSN